MNMPLADQRPCATQDQVSPFDRVVSPRGDGKAPEDLRGLLFEQNLAGVFRATLPGVLLMCNDAFARILGHDSPREITGRSVLSYYVMPGARSALLEVMMAHRCVANYELQLRKRDGSVVWVLENMNLVEDPQHGPVLEGAIIDITKQKRVQEELKTSCEKLERAMEATIQAMARTVEARDPYTAGHERRVAQLAGAIAREMGLDEGRCQAVRMAAIIHDIGKLIVPAEILSKPGRLTDLEYQLIQSHPKVSYEILNIIDFPWPVADIILQHHERLNGSGYPRGLCGDQICLEARILAVADTVEALISHRPYRASPGTQLALWEIEENRGVLYDEEVADACLRLFRDRAFQFEA
jgi:PAS domain S-box-containing protein/putative nucleotidyltransferase with HDIG domain